MNEQEEFEKITRTLSSLDDVPPPNPLRQISARRSYLEYAARLRSRPAVVFTGRKAAHIPSFFRLAIASFSALIASLGIVTGLAYAADGAQPGDLLYPMDRNVEEFRLSLTNDPELQIPLMLSFAEERLAESEQLSLEGDEENLAIALDAYGETISTIAKTVGNAGDHKEALEALIDNALSIHEEQLKAIRSQVPEHTILNLNHAIEAAHNGQNGPPEETGTPETTPGEEPSDSSHGSQKDKPKGPPDDRGPSNEPGPPDNPGNGNN